jgi:hypothetical protein
MGNRMPSTMKRRRENTSRFDIVRSEGVVFRVGLVRERYGRVRIWGGMSLGNGKWEGYGTRKGRESVVMTSDRATEGRGLSGTRIRRYLRYKSGGGREGAEGACVEAFPDC